MPYCSRHRPSPIPMPSSPSARSCPATPRQPRRSVRYATFEAWRERAGSLAAMEGSDGTHLTLTGLGAAERVHVTDVTPGFLPLLGVAPALGRMFEANDLSQPVVILTDAFWRAKLAADPAAIGRQIVLGGRAHTIVGVLPEQFVFPLDQVDVFRPLPLPPADPADPEARAGFRVGVMARLARNATPDGLESRAGRGQSAILAAGAGRRDAARGRDSPRLHENARPSRGGGRARVPHRVCQSCGPAARAIHRSPAGAGGEDGARRAPVRDRTAIDAGGRDARRYRHRGWGAARVVAHTSRGPSCPRAIRRIWPSREVAVSWRVIGVVTMVAAACAGLCGLLPAFVASRAQCCRRAGSRRHTGSA